MFLGSFYNTYTNTELSSNGKSLSHSSEVINIILGIAWNVVWPVLGSKCSNKLVDWKKGRVIESMKKDWTVVDNKV